MKKISLFGSTGSIGINTIDVILKSPPGTFEVLALSANNNYELLARQAIATKAKMAIIQESAHYQKLKTLLQHTKTIVAAGEKGMSEACNLNADLAVAGIVGSAGLKTTYASIINGANIALVNKESLVCAGKIMTDAAHKSKINLIPTDSEHNAIFQVLEQKNLDNVEKIILTASGGPFRTFTKDQLKDVTVKQAINHPKWKMGPKISTDCATMMNKGLEIIEAYHLFNLPQSKIDVVIHPQSIVHGIVSYKDGSSLAQLGNADMRIPITCALYWPERSNNIIAEPLDVTKTGALEFMNPNYELFPALNICRKALDDGSASTIMLNASNEIAVESFLNQQIKFIDILMIVEKMLDKSHNFEINDITQVIEYDRECRIKTKELIKNL
jgi:1-deoxy-D-xylulose-5-phosphate reductoisomerase